MYFLIPQIYVFANEAKIHEKHNSAGSPYLRANLSHPTPFFPISPLFAMTEWD